MGGGAIVLFGPERCLKRPKEAPVMPKGYGLALHPLQRMASVLQT